MNVKYRDYSLLVTAELCKAKGVDEDVFDVENIFPYGITVSDICLRRANVPIELLMWCYFNLPLTTPDKEMVLELAKIVDSTAFYDSYNINNCKRISESKFCKNSEDIQKSSHINNSKLVIESTEVMDSEIIYSSKNILASSNVHSGEDIKNSHYIIGSKGIENSKLTIRSEDVSNSYFVINTNKSSDIILSAGIYNSKNKILCLNISHSDEPMICNKIVSQLKFDNIKSFLIDELIKIKPRVLAGEGHEESFKNHVINTIPNINVDQTIFYGTFKNLDFWDKVVKALDLTEEDKILIYNFTFSPEIVLAKN